MNFTHDEAKLTSNDKYTMNLTHDDAKLTREKCTPMKSKKEKRHRSFPSCTLRRGGVLDGTEHGAHHALHDGARG